MSIDGCKEDDKDDVAGFEMDKFHDGNVNDDFDEADNVLPTTTYCLGRL